MRKHWGLPGDDDLWKQVWTAIQIKDVQAVRARWTRGHATAEHSSEQQIGAGQAVALWAGAALGPSEEVFPQPRGWMLNLGNMTVDINLDD